MAVVAKIILRKFDMQSFVGTALGAAVFMVPGATLLNKDTHDWRAWALVAVGCVLVMIALAGIIGHVLVEIHDEEVAERTRPRPHLVHEPPYVNQRQLLAYDEEGRRVKDVPERNADFVNIKWVNRPEFPGTGADGAQVLADVYYYPKGKSTGIKSPGRWGCCKPQPAVQGVGVPIEQGVVDFPANGKVHELDIAIRYSDRRCFVYNDYSQQVAQDPRCELGEITTIRVELRGTNCQAEHTFELRNDHEGLSIAEVGHEEMLDKGQLGSAGDVERPIADDLSWGS